jgi:hypothetical protein
MKGTRLAAGNVQSDAIRTKVLLTEIHRIEDALDNQEGRSNETGYIGKWQTIRGFRTITVKNAGMSFLCYNKFRLAVFSMPELWFSQFFRAYGKAFLWQPLA